MFSCSHFVQHTEYMKIHAGSCGSLYVHTKLEAIKTLLPEDMEVLNPVRYQAISFALCICKTQKYIQGSVKEPTGMIF